MSVYENNKSVTTAATENDDQVSRLGYEDTLEEQAAYDDDLAQDRRDAIAMADSADTDEEPVSDEVAATRAQIEETRAHLSGTVDAIKEKLTPANIIEDAKDAVKAAATAKVEEVKDKVSDMAHSVMETAKDFVHSVTDTAKSAVHSTSDAARPTLTKAQSQGERIVDTIRMNPLPAAIAGFGLGWLLLSIRKQNSVSNTYKDYNNYNDYNGANSFDRPYNGGSTTTATGFGYQPMDTSVSFDNGPSKTERVKDTLHQAGDSISGVASSAKDKVSDVASSAKDTVTNLAATAKDKAGDIAHSAQDKVSDLAYAAKDKSQAAVSSLDSFVHDNPLAAGAIALLVGTAVGLALPSTRKENEWMGDTRDRLKDKATDAISDMTHKVQNVAEAALGTAKDSLHTAVDTAKDSFQDVKNQVTDKVKSEAQSQGLAPAPAAPPAPEVPAPVSAF